MNESACINKALGFCCCEQEANERKTARNINIRMMYFILVVAVWLTANIFISSDYQ
jgi:hypothetical protein